MSMSQNVTLGLLRCRWLVGYAVVGDHFSGSEAPTVYSGFGRGEKNVVDTRPRPSFVED